MKIKYICTTTVRLLPLLHSTTATTIVTRSRVTAAVGASGKGQHAEHKPDDVLVCSKTTGTSPRRLPTNCCVIVIFTRTKPPGFNRLFANTNSFSFTSIFVNIIMLIMFSRVVAVAAVLTQPFSYVHAFTLSVATMSVNVQKAKLWDMPVSNNGARCRCVYRCTLAGMLFLDGTCGCCCACGHYSCLSQYSGCSGPAPRP